MGSPLSGLHSFTFAPARAPVSTDDERPPNETASRCRDSGREHRHLARPASAPLLHGIRVLLCKLPGDHGYLPVHFPARQV